MKNLLLQKHVVYQSEQSETEEMLLNDIFYKMYRLELALRKGQKTVLLAPWWIHFGLNPYKGLH